VLVVGLGNPDRGDDGIGPMVARALAGRLPADVAIHTLSGDVLSLLSEWEGFDALVCVDAAAPAPMAAPGRIHRLDLADADLPREVSFTSSHGFGLAEAIALGRALQSAPQDIIVYAVEGKQFEGGAAVTPEVAAAAADAADCIVAEVERLRQNSAA
jgi:hydrogenase maturation protease